LTNELLLDRANQVFYQIVLCLLLQLKQLSPRLWERDGAVTQEVEYRAEMLAASVNQDPAFTAANVIIITIIIIIIIIIT